MVSSIKIEKFHYLKVPPAKLLFIDVFYERMGERTSVDSNLQSYFFKNSISIFQMLTLMNLLIFLVDPTPNQMQVSINHNNNMNANDAANGNIANRCQTNISGQFPATQQKSHRMVVGIPPGQQQQQFQLPQVCIK